MQQATLGGEGVTPGPNDVQHHEIRKGNRVRVLPDYDGSLRAMHGQVLVVKKNVKIQCVIDALRDGVGQQ